MRKIVLRDTDRFIYHKDIKPYLPQRIFDAHSHILINRFNPQLNEIMPLATSDPLLNNVDISLLELWWKTLFPDAIIKGLVLGFPTKGCEIAEINNYLSQNIPQTGNHFSILTHPSTSGRDLEQQILQSKPFGLKPYLVFAQVSDPNSARITDIIPEEQIAIANKFGLAVTLHVAKSRGMADVENLNDLSRLIYDYPDCNFILAHCGRCFITPNMEDALSKLPVAENLWIDTSAVCDMGVFINLFSRYDISRILFGTDLVTASGFRGAYVKMGMSWDACSEDMFKRPNGQPICATFAAYENLYALFQAAKFCRLSVNDINNIFYNNSARLFKIS